MSSRLVRSSVTPIDWRPAAPAPVKAMRPRSAGGQVEGAEARIAELEAQMEARTGAAYHQGQMDTEAAAAHNAAARLEPVLAGLNGIIQDLSGTRKKFRMQTEEDTVKLAIAIARRVLHRELATDPEAILGLVLAAFQKLNAREIHRLRVSPADARAIEENRSRLELPAGLEIVCDTALLAGSAIFETSRGDLDASVDTQLAEIERGFADVMRRRLK